jgi:hypothetical protein
MDTIDSKANEVLTLGMRTINGMEEVIPILQKDGKITTSWEEII